MSRWVPVAALCLVALVTGFALASGLGGDEENPPAQEASAPDREQAGDGGSTTGSDESSGQSDQSAQSTGEPPAPTETVTDPVALNDDGFDLINQGRYEEAIPILQRAVEGLEGSGDITYAYALYNLGNALRLAGRTAEAIPILEQRLQIPNQVETVKAELKQAKKDLKAQEKSGA